MEYTTFNDLWNDPELLSETDRERVRFEASLISKLVEARESIGLTQKELAERSGLTQSAIARLENMKATPQIDTLFRVLEPLGYTLVIVPVGANEPDSERNAYRGR
jgi:transcriptional regulator with XRE-family HTH domain